MSDPEDQPSLQHLAEQVGDLTDLFRRRLLEDREKQRMFDALYEELKSSRALAEAEATLPLARAVFAVVDRMDSDGSEFARTVADELSEGLRLVGLTALVPTGGPFDPSTQEIHGEVDRSDGPDFDVVRTVRRGWALGTRVVRPASVVVVGAPAPSSDEDEIDGSRPQE